MAVGGDGAPCGACKFLRRKCVKGCVFAPFFSTEELGASQFAAIHKIFGASNFSKLLQHIGSEEERYDAVVSISYEAQARLYDPIYGCVSHIFALQHQVALLQEELRNAHACLISTSDEQSFRTSFTDGKHREIPTSSPNNIYVHQCSSNEPESSYESSSEDTRFFTHEEGFSFPTNMPDYCHYPISTAQKMNVFEDDEISFEANPEHGGDLQDLALSLLKRRSSRANNLGDVHHI
ncbi:hypothetical protein KI387_005071 [Taxus chinensis]|uniref:LOB domain-containing protein n=1 Tax=Taxus chinensis TaxID=29808 RepID=A0AA38GMV4_TAXCH|nr:hypothetical protein KI387_005071 [Taxus chinensis]